MVGLCEDPEPEIYGSWLRFTRFGRRLHSRALRGRRHRKIALGSEHYEDEMTNQGRCWGFVKTPRSEVRFRYLAFHNVVLHDSSSTLFLDGGNKSHRDGSHVLPQELPYGLFSESKVPKNRNSPQGNKKAQSQR